MRLTLLLLAGVRLQASYFGGGMSELRSRAEILGPRTAQFLVERMCEIENPDDGNNIPFEGNPIPFWVAFPGMVNVPLHSGPQCDAIHYRVIRANDKRMLGSWLCEHMGRIVE